ncbi:MAG: flagellar FlbD family protein [Anaerotignum sp.]|jgi:flagellar protein FlbD|nr:flagellar FlbD family protein [Anaerotignum sp.]MCI8866702.1 flagellar FlbD family protein [Anaerotignum sp.]
MIKLTKLNNEIFVVNCNQIESIEKIPETKIVLMNKDFYIVQEDLDEIIEKIIEFNAKITDLNKRIQIVQD